MTGNQIAYVEHLENIRHNSATEAEANRANLAREQETSRANLASEALTSSGQVEQARHNIATEKLTASATKASIKNAQTAAAAATKVASINAQATKAMAQANERIAQVQKQIEQNKLSAADARQAKQIIADFNLQKAKLASDLAIANKNNDTKIAMSALDNIVKFIDAIVPF